MPNMVTSSMVAAARSTANGSSKAKPVLEIIPDLRFIVFHGSEHEAQPIKLTGRVRLTTPEPLSIMRPKVRLEGKRKIKWYLLGPVSASVVEDKRVFWNQEQKLGIETAHKVKAGVIEWRFEFELSPAMPESVEGLRETYIVYNLHAGISRPGWNAKDLTAHEHIRLVRTLGPESMESTRSRVNADIWANKVSYSISIPTDAVVYGTSITADVELSPLKKGIRLGKIELRLQETVVRRIQASEVPDLRADRAKSEELEVAKMDMDFPQQSIVTYEDETVDNPTVADEMFRFRATLPLPKSLHLCRQDVDMHQITVTHRFKLMVNIHNPEGHVSQLVCRLPVKLFISPNLPVDESNQVRPGAHPVSDAELNSAETNVAAPPEYGRHQLDQMYSDIDVSGFFSRTGSASGTPIGYSAQSRRGSRENVLSLNGVAEEDVPANHGSAAPGLLLSRLTDLQDADLGRQIQLQRQNLNYSPSGGNSPSARDQSPSANVGGGLPRSASGFFAAPASRSPAQASSSGCTSGRTSDEDHSSGIQQHDYNMDDLTRVPSYGAAVRVPGSVTPINEGPPSYIEATSRPPSPTTAGSSVASSLSPGTTIFPPRSGQTQQRATHAAAPASRDHQEMNVPMPSLAQLALTPPQASSSSATLSSSSALATQLRQQTRHAVSPHPPDDESRLRMLRAGS